MCVMSMVMPTQPKGIAAAEKTSCQNPKKRHKNVINSECSRMAICNFLLDLALLTLSPAYFGIYCTYVKRELLILLALHRYFLNC